MWRKGNPFALLVGMQIGATTVESSMEISQKIKNGFAFWSSDPTFGNIFEGTQNTNSKEHKHFYVHRQDAGAAQMSISKWVDETTMGHLHNGILLSHKKKKMLPFAAMWMDLENIMLSKISQSGKDKWHMISFLCGI